MLCMPSQNAHSGIETGKEYNYTPHTKHSEIGLFLNAANTHFSLFPLCSLPGWDFAAVWLCIMPLYSLRSWRDGTANGYFCTNISLPCPCSDFQHGYKKRCCCCRQCIKLIQRHRVSFQMLPLLCKCLIWNQCFLLPSFMSVALWGIKNTVFVSRKTTVTFDTVFIDLFWLILNIFNTFSNTLKLILYQFWSVGQFLVSVSEMFREKKAQNPFRLQALFFNLLLKVFHTFQ